MRRVVLLVLGLISLTGCASSHHEKDVEGASFVEKETHEHHGHHGSTIDSGSDNIGQDMLDDVESGLLSGFLQAIIDSIFHRDDSDD